MKLKRFKKLTIMPFKPGVVTNPNGTPNNRGGAGRPPNWFRKTCAEKIYVIDMPDFWAKIVQDKNEKTSDRLDAALRLVEFAEGKAIQRNENQNIDDPDRPTTDVLIETIRALREELGSLRKGAPVENGK